MSVNKYAPTLNIQVSEILIIETFSLLKFKIKKVATAFISLINSGDYSTASINILDEDVYPYNFFRCSIENDDDFYIMNDNNRKTVNYFKLVTNRFDII